MAELAPKVAPPNLQSWAELRWKLHHLPENRDGFLCEGHFKEVLQRMSYPVERAESLMIQFHRNADGFFHTNADGKIRFDEFVTFVMFNEGISESDQVAIFREFYKDAVEKDIHLSAKEKSWFIANLTDQLHSVLDTWSTMLHKQACRPMWKDPLYVRDFPFDPLPFGILIY